MVELVLIFQNFELIDWCESGMLVLLQLNMVTLNYHLVRIGVTARDKCCTVPHQAYLSDHL